MDVDWYLVLGSVFASFVLVPAAVAYVALVPGPPDPGTAAFFVFTAVVMSPGLLLGGTGLWVAARG